MISNSAYVNVDDCCIGKVLSNCHTNTDNIRKNELMMYLNLYEKDKPN